MNTSRNKQADSLFAEIQNLRNSIIDEKQLTDKLNKDRTAKEAEFQNQLKMMEDNHNQYVEELLAYKQDIQAQIEAVEDKSRNLEASYTKKNENLKKKIKNLKDSFMESASDMKKREYQKALKEYESQSEELKNTRKENTSNYNTKIKALNKKYNSLIREQEETKAALEKEETDYVAEKEELISNINLQRDYLIKQHEMILKNTHEENTRIISELEAKTNKAIVEKQNEIAFLKQEKENCIAQNNDINKLLEQEQTQREAKIEEIQKNYALKIEGLQNNNKTLENILHDKENEVLKKAQEYSQSYNTLKLHEDEVVKLLENEKDSTVQRLEEDYQKEKDARQEALENYLGERLREYREESRNCDIKLSQQAKQLEVLKAQLEEEKNSQEKDYEEKKANYEKLLNSLIEENSVQKQRCLDIVNDYEARIKTLNADLQSLKFAQKSEIEKTVSEYHDRIDQIRDVYQKSRNELDEAIKQTNDEIASLNMLNEKLNDKYSSTVKQLKERKQSETERFENICTELEEKKNELEKNIAEENQKLLDQNVSNRNSLDAIDANIEELTLKHQSDIASIKEEYTKKLLELKEEYRGRTSRALSEHEGMLKDLEEKTKNKSEELTDSFSEFEKQCKDTENQLEELKKDLQLKYDRQSEELKQRQEGYLKEIEAVKQRFEDEKNLFEKQKEELSAEKERRLQEIKDDYSLQVEKIVEDYETIPTAELNEIKEKAQLKSDELEACKKEIERKTAEKEEELQKIKEENDARIEIKKEEYNKVSRDLESVKAKNDAQYAILVQKLEAKKKEFSTLKKENDQKILDIEKYNQQELVKVAAIYDERLLEAKNSLQEKYDLHSKKSQQEIADLKKEFDLKSADYQKQLDARKREKDQFELELSVKYENEVNNTRKISDELSVYNAKLDNQLEEQKKTLEHQKTEQENDLNKIKLSYAQILEQKKAEYNKRLEQIRNKIDGVKDEIYGLEKEKFAKQNQFELYVKTRNQEIDDSLRSCDETLDNLKQKMETVSKEETVYLELHEKRMKVTAEQIGDIMDQYAQIENMVPSFMESKRAENEQHLLKLADEFKLNYQKLEKENEEMLEKLKKQRLELIAEVAEETSNLINGYNSSIGDINSRIYDLERSYRTLIKDELEKQKKLADSLKDVKERIARENEESFRVFDTNVKSHQEKISVLNSQYKEDEERLIASYKPILSDTLAQSLNLENIKKANIAEIESYRQKLNEADDEIQKKKERLLLEYLVRIKEIARDYDKSLTRNKEKIKNDDILNSTIVDIFKNSSL